MFGHGEYLIANMEYYDTILLRRYLREGLIWTAKCEN